MEDSKLNVITSLEGKSQKILMVVALEVFLQLTLSLKIQNVNLFKMALGARPSNPF
jgi:hypothetical protein